MKYSMEFVTMIKRLNDIIEVMEDLKRVYLKSGDLEAFESVLNSRIETIISMLHFLKEDYKNRMKRE